MDSILTSIKKLLGMEEDYVYFDTDIVFNINTVMFSLNQFGIGPPTGFIIFDKNAKWVDLLGERKDLESVKSYIFLKVKLLFDPPTSSFVIESINKMIIEFEWRLINQVEGGVPIGG